MFNLDEYAGANHCVSDLYYQGTTQKEYRILVMDEEGTDHIYAPGMIHGPGYSSTFFA